MTVLKRTLKIVLVIIMIFGLMLSISNLLSIESQAKGPEGGIGYEDTIIVNPDGTIDCQGPEYDC